MPEKKNTIGRFEIIEKIGEGPIGAVYKALDPVIRRTVAIKVIKLYALEETATFAEVFEKIYRVVRTSTSLNHPNICIIYDLSEEKKIPYITMEYVEGHDLESLLQKKHQFKRGELLNILQQACDAIDFAHKKNVIHQDLKSTNILVTPDLHVKITDFGIAGLDEIAAAQTKKLLSIPFYISPEQALGERVTSASDLYSLGVIMYQLLSGQLPFPGTSAANVIMMIARDHPTIPKELENSGIIKDDWDSFFSIALAKPPNQRFRAAKEMFEAISAVVPPSDTSYYPYSFLGFAAESTGKFEKTYVNESPTVMIDAAEIMEEPSAPSVQAKRLDQTGPKPAPPVPPPPPPAPPVEAKPDSSTVLIQTAQMEERAETVMIPTPPKEVPSPPPAPVPSSAPTQLLKVPPKPVESEVTMKPTPAPTPPPVEKAPRTPIPTPPKVSVPPPPPPPPPPTPPPPKKEIVAEAVPEAPIMAPIPLEIPTPIEAPPKAAGAPNLKRYMTASIALVFLILLVGGGILYWNHAKKQKEAEPTPTPLPVQPGPKPVIKPAEPATPTVTAGELAITTEPAGATVLVNDEEKGVTPLNLPEMPLGKYLVKLQLKDYQDFEQEVEITQETPNVTLPVTLEKTAPVVGTLVIESTPPGATIVIGKKALGVTPKTLKNLKVSKYTVILKKEGYQDYTGSIRVNQDETATLRAQMTAIPKVEEPKPIVEQPKEEEIRPGMLVEMGPDVTPPKAIKRTGAKPPEAAKKLKLQGSVTVSVLVSETGKVIDTKIIKSAHPLLDDAAIAAVKEWTYEPARKKGVPVKMWVPITMTFRL